MIEGRFFSGLRALRLIAPLSAVSCAMMLAVLTPSPAQADVEVNLSGIGLRTNTDERIAPGRSPVELKLPEPKPEAHIQLTPPPGSHPNTLPSPSVTAPVVLAPANSRPVTPTALAPAPAATPAPQTPVKQAAFPDPASIAPIPLLPIAPLTPPPPLTPTTSETAAKPASVQTASLPPPSSAASHHLRFEENEAAIPLQTRKELELVAAELMRHSDRIEIQAYAGIPQGLSSASRRLSLQRGLAVRKFLVEQGVLQSRIDVRALGGVRDNGPSERVDILLSSR